MVRSTFPGSHHSLARPLSAQGRADNYQSPWAAWSSLLEWHLEKPGACAFIKVDWNHHLFRIRIYSFCHPLNTRTPNKEKKRESNPRACVIKPFYSQMHSINTKAHLMKEVLTQVPKHYFTCWVCLGVNTWWMVTRYFQNPLIHLIVLYHYLWEYV